MRKLVLAFALLCCSAGYAQTDPPAPAQEVPSTPPRIVAGVQAGHLIQKRNPVYPPEAKAKGISGTVALHAVIGADGSVKDLKVISGPPELADAAMDAVNDWRYSPYTLNGVPTEVETTIMVNFNLAGGATPPPHPVARISSGVMQGQLISKVQPIYPPLAKQDDISGTVALFAVIGTDGAVKDLKVISGPSQLQNAALDAVKQWRYKPYILNGTPTEVQTTIMVNFNLSHTPRF